MFCPYYKNKDVFDGFNNIIQSLGGKPMTEEEFRSAELRNRRRGLDYSAMEAAYKAYHANNGNLMDLAPNGQPSLVFQQLLQIYNGDINKAIKAKTNLYSKTFRKHFGDWLSDSISKDKIDINGEPILPFGESLEKAKASASLRSKIGIQNKFKRANVYSTFGESISSALQSGKEQSSKDIVSRFSQLRLFSPQNEKLAEVLQRHEIPTVFKNHEDGSLMKTYTVNGKSAISIDPQLANNVSNQYLADTYLHEIMHAITTDPINDAKTKEDIKFRDQNRNVFNIFNKLFPKELFSRMDMSGLYYCLENEKEFASEFATRQDVRSMLYQRAILEDKKNNKAPILALKNLVNSLSRLLANSNVFNTNKDQLKLYQNIATSYLLNRPILKFEGLQASKIIKEVYKSLDNSVLSNDQIQQTREDLIRATNYAEVNNSMRVDRINDNDLGLNTRDSEEIAQKRIEEMCNNIATALSKRQAAIKVSQLPEEYKSENIEILRSQVQSFKDRLGGTFYSIASLVQQIAPQLLIDSKKIHKIRQDNMTISDAEYMFLAHDNFGTYQKILSEINSALNSPTVIDLLIKELEDKPQQDRATLNDIQRIIQIVQSSEAVAADATSLMSEILINNMKKRFAQIGNDVHSPTIADYINHLKTIGYDTNWFYTTVGSMDSAKDEALRAMAYLIDKATHKADRDTHDRVVELMQLKEQLRFGESVLDLYEVDDNGFTTGYLVRDLNYGKFFRKRQEFMEKLNLKYGLDPSNREQPKGDDGVKWSKEVNDWLSKNCHRKYKKEYYEAFANLSADTMRARDSIQIQIKAIKQSCKDEFGNYHFDRLTDSEWNTLRGLYIQKKQLASDYDINGELKIEGTPEYRIAKELQKLNETLFNSSDKVKKDTKRWQADRNKIIQECGGLEEMAKGEDGNFDFNKLRKWDSRNSKTRLKVNEETGKALLWETIDNEAEKPVYAIIVDGVSDHGARYEELQQQKYNILSTYRDYNTGDINPSKLQKSIQNKIQEIDKELAKIRKQAVREDKDLKKLSKNRAKIFRKYAQSSLTDVYKEMHRLAVLRDKDEPGYLDTFQRNTGRLVEDVDGEISWQAKPWFRKVVAKQAYYDRFMEVLPGDGYLNSDENNDLLDKDFDESYGQAFVPKKELYDNFKQYNKIIKSKTLKALYDKTYQTIKESNELQVNRNYVDNYLLPQITGSFFKYLKKHSGKWRMAWDFIKTGNVDPSSSGGALREYFKDTVGIGEKGWEQDGTYGQFIDQALSDQDQFGDIINSKDPTFGSEISGERPDGRQLNMIPQYYTRRLNDASQLSSDLIGILGEYYNQSQKYKNKKQIEATCESMVDMIENRNHEKVSITGSIGNLKRTTRNVTGKSSNTYKAARKFLDMNLYNIRSSRMQVNIFGREVNMGKVAQLFRAATTLVNLGCNIAVAGTGFTTATWAHIVNSIVGQKYSFSDAFAATRFVLHHLVENGMGAKYIEDHNSKDLLMLIMEHFNVASQLERKMKDSNRNNFINAITHNWAFGGLTMFDFCAKAPIAISTIMSYRYYNGEFVTKDDVIMNNILNPEETKKRIKEWKKGKSLLSIMKEENGKLTVDKQYYKQYKQIEDVLHFRIERYAENADGMATESQKAAITTNALGAAVLVHRQYFPLMLQERFGDTVWDNSTQQFKGGSFRSGLQLLNVLSKGYSDEVNLQNFQVNRKKSILTGLAAGAALGSFLPIVGPMAGVAIGSALGALFGARAKNSRSLQRYLYDNSSESQARLCRFRRQQLKRLATEIALYKLVVCPAVALICAYADSDDDNKLMQLLAYIAVRTKWEVFTPYRFDDALNNFKTVSAQTGTLDAIQSVAKSVPEYALYSIMPRGQLLDTFLGGSFNDYDPSIQRGIYSDYNIPFTNTEWNKASRDMFKATPFHHAYEQILDSKSKRSYYENQIIQNKSSDDPLYNWALDKFNK